MEKEAWIILSFCYCNQKQLGPKRSHEVAPMHCIPFVPCMYITLKWVFGEHIINFFAIFEGLNYLLLCILKHQLLESRENSFAIAVNRNCIFCFMRKSENFTCHSFQIFSIFPNFLLFNDYFKLSQGEGRGESWAPYVPPKKTSKKLSHYMNAIKHQNRDPLPIFSHNPKSPPKRICKWLCSYGRKIGNYWTIQYKQIIKMCVKDDYKQMEQN